MCQGNHRNFTRKRLELAAQEAAGIVEKFDVLSHSPSPSVCHVSRSWIEDHVPCDRGVGCYAVYLLKWFRIVKAVIPIFLVPVYFDECVVWRSRPRDHQTLSIPSNTIHLGNREGDLQNQHRERHASALQSTS